MNSRLLNLHFVHREMSLIFICDQSPSMGDGWKLDIAKAALETFAGAYSKQGAALPFMLLGCGGRHKGNDGMSRSDYVVRSSLVDNVGHFEDEVKMMSAMSDEVKAVADFSKSVDYALSILGKFRLRDNIDTFGFGRKLTLAPAHIFIFADKQSQKEPFKLNRDEGYLHDFISHPYRWDHHVHLFVIEDSRSSKPKQNGDKNNEGVLESGIAELVHSTGGSIFTVSSMREARSVMTTLLQNVIGATPTVTMRLGISGDDEMNSSMMATMKVPQSERATNENTFIPEDTLIEGGMESLPQRSSVPTFKLTQLYGEEEIVQSCWQLLKEINLPSEAFEVSLRLGGTNGQEITTLGNGSQSYFVGTSGGSTSTVFGLLSPNLEPGALSHELRLLPANFPTLVRVIKTGLQINGNVGGGFGDGQAMLTRFRSEFEEYISSIPGYCVAPVMKILHTYGIAKIAHGNNPELQQQMQYKLHSRVHNRIQKWMRVACEELIDIDIRVVDKMPIERIITALNPAAFALASSSAAQQQLPVGPYTRAMPKSAAEVPKMHTLAVWENMRKAVFGGTSMVHRGLSVPGLPGNGCRVPAGFKMKDEERIWFESAAGATFIPRVKPREMSEYVFVLARDECLRDPEAVSAESTSNVKGKSILEEEDTEQGILKRKLAAVNFGNRFNSKKAGSGGAQTDVVDIDAIGLEDINNTISAATSKSPSFSINSGLASSIAEGGDGMFADTPYPEREIASPVPSPVGSPATSQEDAHSLSSVDSPNTTPATTAAATAAAVPAVSVLPPRVQGDVSKKRPREASAADAASEWRKEWSKTQKRHYWFNARTKKSRWDDPNVQAIKTVKQ